MTLIRYGTYRHNPLRTKPPGLFCPPLDITPKTDMLDITPVVLKGIVLCLQWLYC